MNPTNAPSFLEIVSELLLLALLSAVVGWMWGLVMPEMAARFMEGLIAGGGGLSLSAMWFRRVSGTSDEEEK